MLLKKCLAINKIFIKKTLIKTSFEQILNIKSILRRFHIHHVAEVYLSKAA